MKKNLVVVVSSLLLLADCGSKSLYKAGTYEGSAKGRNDEIKVSVTVSEKEITKVEITDQKETEEIASEALTSVPEAIVKKNSVEVDDSTGATITSKAIKEAVKSALEKAK